MKKLEIGAVYRHYKGTKAKVLAEAIHSETREPLVIYLHLEDGVIWARPKKMFLETITVKGNPKRNNGRKRPVSYGTRKVERFKKINQRILIKPSKK
jgi:hypothetical protein